MEENGNPNKIKYIIDNHNYYNKITTNQPQWTQDGGTTATSDKEQNQGVRPRAIPS